MNRDTPHILLINPWIHDFAAYDFWAKPIGLLYLAAILRNHGCRVSYIDCLDRFHPKAKPTDPHARRGRGPYLKTKIPKPKGLDDIPRNFSRYGINPEWFKDDLYSFSRPNLVLITSMMTYWHPGVREAIQIIKTTYPKIPVVLGGIYASLCPDHARRFSAADRIVVGPGETHLPEIVKQYTGFSVNLTFDPENLDDYPFPAFDLQRTLGYIPILTSKGCPFSCAYCASRYLNPKRLFRSPSQVVEEIRFWHKTHHVVDFAFYDDALLVDAERHAIPMLEKIIDSNLAVRFHTPNAIHIREITSQTAVLMKRAGFESLRLGLETAIFENRSEMDAKVTETEFRRAVRCLERAGFHKKQVGVYLLAGLPGQSFTVFAQSIEMINTLPVTPVWAYYSPIPHTALWEKAVSSSRYDLESDPIFSNNAIFPCRREPFSWADITNLKNLVK